jgi:acyl-CoA dehydrogenase
VPVEDLLGEENKGFSYLGHNLPRSGWASPTARTRRPRRRVRFAKEYVQERKVFGKPVASFQNTKFELAACQAEVDAAQAVADRALEPSTRAS